MSVDVAFEPMPTVAEIVGSLQSALESINGLISNFNTGGVTKTYLEAIALALGSDASSIPDVLAPGAYEILTTLENAEFALTAKGSFLDLKGADVGVTRKTATKSEVFVQFSLSPPPSVDTVIPAGAHCVAEPADPSGSPILFITQADVTYLGGQAHSPLVLAQAQNAGSVGNVEPGAINLVLTGPTGYTVTNPARAAGGTDEEGDDTPNGGYRARVLAAIPNASQCTKSAIELAALSYNGVASAYLKDNTDSDGITFLRGRCQLYVDDGSGNMGTNNPTLIATMQADFDSGLYRAAGTEVDVHGSEITAVTVSLNYNPSLSYLQTIGTTADIDAALSSAIALFVDSRPIGRVVTLASIVEVASEVAGVANVPLSSVKINGVASDFIPSVSQAPRCVNGSVDVTPHSVGPLPQYG